MSDDKFTRIAAGLLTNVRDLVDWGIDGGHTTPDQLRLTVVARKEQARRLHDAGLSVREIAAALNEPKSTIHDDLKVPEAGQNRPETGQRQSPPKPPIPSGKFETIVVDPPWPMTKIERDVRPNQAGFSYPTMDERELREFAGSVANMAADDCHIFMWTTQKFQWLAKELIELYGFRPTFTMVWHKSGGFQPFKLPQFNCEFVVYGRRGSVEFVSTKNFDCCFNAPRREHSRKPDEFYDMVALATKGPRVDVFSREPREGFEQFGNETDHFAGREP